MSLFALGLVLTSAVFHATWNLFAKRAGADFPFFWLAFVIGAVVFAPFALTIVVVGQPQLTWITLVFILVAVCLQTLYAGTLTAGYRAGDLSLVYPIGRASGPLLATVGVIALFSERPTGVAIGGALGIVAGALVLTGDPRALRAGGAGTAVGFALATGVVIATYTLWDKTAVSGLLVLRSSTTGRSASARRSSSRHSLRRRENIREAWTSHRAEVIGVGILSRLAYIRVLTALVVSPVSYVAPAREIGILIGAILGARVLAEGQLLRRGIGAAAMVAGLLALALG